MTLKICIGLSFYQDFHSLRRMLMSLQSYPIDLIIAIDGKYKGHPAKRQLSSKECLDLFRSFQTKSIIIPWQNTNEVEKRNVYFAMCENDFDYIDILIVMDSDEYFIHNKTNWTLFMEDLEKRIEDNKGTYKQSYSVPVHLKHKGELTMPEDYVENLPRLFYKPSELQYVDDHHTIRNKHTGVAMTYTSSTLCKHILLGHDHDLRSKEYLEQRTEYQKRLIEEENLKRKERQNEFIKTIEKT